MKIYRITTKIEACDNLTIAKIRRLIDQLVNKGVGVWMRCEKGEMKVEYMDQLTKQAAIKD